MLGPPRACSLATRPPFRLPRKALVVVRARVGQVMGNQLLSSLSLSPAGQPSWQVVPHAWVGASSSTETSGSHCG